LITLKELLTSPCDNKEHLENLEELLVKLNHLRAAYGKPLRVTSGYRSLQKHLAVYAAKGITDQSKIPMQSRHLYGFAADLVPIEDDIKHLHDFINNNIGLMSDIGLYFEAFEYSPQWLHCQSVPPKSGKRFFKP
jgi:uncharacterized protein YcbK (DUF882 family)